MGYIYKITNTVNKKAYIGQTKQDDPNKRWKGHISAIKYDNGCPLLTAAFKKHGVDKFKFEIIIICFDEDVCKFEREYVRKYNTLAPNGYNAVDGGEVGGMFKGKHHSEESKKIIGEKSREIQKDPEFRKANGEKISAALKTSEKWKTAVKEGRVGTVNMKNRMNTEMSEEIKEKISISLKKYYTENGNNRNYMKLSEIMTKVNGKPVKQYDKDGNFIKEYFSIAEGARQTSLTRKNVQACVSGYSKTAGGFIWRYADVTQQKVSKEVST
jgi:group I intron endonuclease